MADDGFVLAVDPSGSKRRVPKHYLDNPGLGNFKLPPSARKSSEPGSADKKEASK